jgi:hypothetical protein
MIFVTRSAIRWSRMQRCARALPLAETVVPDLDPDTPALPFDAMGGRLGQGGATNRTFRPARRHPHCLAYAGQQVGS